MPEGYEISTFFLHKDLVNVVRIFLHAIKGIELSRGVGIGYRRFHKMTRTIKFVPISVFESLVWLTDREIYVKVSVGALIFLDLRNQCIYLFIKLGRGVLPNYITSALYPFSNVAVPVNVGFFESFGVIFIVIKIKSVYSARILKTVINRVYRNFPI